MLRSFFLPFVCGVTTMFLLLRRLEVLLWNSKDRGTKNYQETLVLKKFMITLKWEIKKQKGYSSKLLLHHTH